MKIFNTKNKKGFSILEVLAAVFVLSIGITAVLSLMSNSISNSVDSRNSIIASALAQEGAELVRNIRDNNFLGVYGSTDPFYGLGEGDYSVDYVNGIENASSQDDYRLNYDNDGFYVHSASGGIQTRFLRKINVEEDIANSGKKITSMVIWRGTNFPQPSDCNMGSGCIYAEEILTDWGS